MLKRFLIPTLLIVISVLALSCQSEGPMEPKQSDVPTEDKQPEEEATGMEPIDIGDITNITWIWSELIENPPSAQSVVPNPDKYTLTFWNDGTFNFKADCNSGGGSYTIVGSSIEFGPMATTMAMCPPDSLHDTYLALLGEIDTFGMVDDKLVFSLKANSGEMRFANGGPAKLPVTPTKEAESPVPEEKTILVGPEKVECVGVGPQECYLVKENIDDEWQYFYDQIEGFNWEPGYTYELRVAVHHVENPPADASSLRYELIEVIDKVETPVKSRESDTYIRIEQPLANVEVDASKPILVSGMGAGLFEGNVVVKILDSEGNELALQATIIQSPEAGTGGEGPWETEISISIDSATRGKIVAFSPSPKDGEGWMASDEIDVQLNPVLAPNVSLEHTPWLLRSFPQVDEFNTLLTVFPVNAFFNPDDSMLSGLAGCNNYFTSYAADGNTLEVNTPIATTRMMCPEPQMALENAYLAALEEVSSYEMTFNTMELKNKEGEPLLIFQVDPYSLSESFTREELANTSYLNEFAQDETVQLVDGSYREQIVEGSASKLLVMLTTHAVFGDVTGNGSEDAVVVLVSQPGGSGSFYDLAVVRKQDDVMTNLARVRLGDRVQIKRLHMEDGEVVVDMLTQGPDDPMCCPTRYASNRYAFMSGELVLVNSEVIK